MMRYLLMVLMVITTTQVTASGVYDIIESLAERAEQATTTSAVEVVELFQAQSPEELEAALTDGYPMPWLEEILNDESIPEEDRYWLDCRMRSAIAQDLHLFFDRDGKPIHVEAAWIAPGEDYWREHVMVRPILPYEEEAAQARDEEPQESIDYENFDEFAPGNVREPFSENSPTLMSDPPGDILNLYGEKVGELAVINRSVVLARDASVGAVQSGGNERLENWERTPYACILYPDGSFVEHPFDHTGTYRAAVSADGSTIIFICIHMTYPENEDDVVDAWVFDKEGQMVHRVTPPEEFYGTRLPQISYNGKYCCYPLATMELVVINCIEGTPHGFLEASNPGRDLQVFSLSPDGDYLCAGGHSGGKIVRTETLEQVWTGPLPELINEFSVISCSRNAEFISCIMKRGEYPDYYYEHLLYRDEKIIYHQIFDSNALIKAITSPNGSFLLMQNENSHSVRSSLPMIIQTIRGGE